jgi:hypothetical protein
MARFEEMQCPLNTKTVVPIPEKVRDVESTGREERRGGYVKRNGYAKSAEQRSSG